MKISVCMIVKDEEEHLHKALKSVPEHYEIIVTDTGSCDSTLSIADKLGALTYSYSWSDDFAAARNYCASKATGDYILVLDADEELPADTDERILEFVTRFPRAAGCVFINNTMSTEMKRHRMVRFYPNIPSFGFSGIVHEQVYEKDQPAHFEILPIEILHHGYEEEEYDRKQKSDRYLPLYEAHLARSPNDGYMLYQVGKLYYSRNEYILAERYLMQSLQQQQKERLYFPVMLVMLGYVLKELNRSKEAQQLLLPMETVYSNFPDLFFLLGLLAMDNADLPGIEHYFSTALAIGDTDKYTSVYGVGSFKAAYNLGLFYELTGNEDLSQQCYRFASEYEYEPALQRLK